MKRCLIAGLLLMLGQASVALNVSTGEKDGSITTDEIIQAAVECEDCADWKVLGVCFWLKCSIYDCEVLESPRVGHYIPDLVIASYTYQSDWMDTRDWNATPSGAISQTESYRDQATPLDFKSVDVIAHPALPIYNAIGSSEYFCESMLKTPLLPFFLSSTDPMWNDPTAEQLFPQSMLGWPKFNTNTGLPGLADGYWAPLYPRCGWGAHPYDPINAAVAAHRAGEIVTRPAQPHVYFPVSGSCENKCWPPSPLTVNEHHDNRFQMLSPSKAMSTRTFDGSVTWANGKNISRQSYLWAMWRYYACCDKKGSYLGKVDIQ